MLQTHPDGTLYTPPKVDALEFLREWKRLNPHEHDYLIDHQENDRLSRSQEEQGAHPSQQEFLDLTEEERTYLEAEEARQAHSHGNETPYSETTTGETPLQDAGGKDNTKFPGVRDEKTADTGLTSEEVRELQLRELEGRRRRLKREAKHERKRASSNEARLKKLENKSAKILEEINAILGPRTPEWHRQRTEEGRARKRAEVERQRTFQERVH